MKYFRAFRLVGNEAIDEYYKISTELAQYQNALYKKNFENPDEDTSEIELKINDLHLKMYETYGMIPHLHYHAMAEKGFVSILVDEKEYKRQLKSGQIQKGQARKLELVKDGSEETGFSIPVFKMDNPEAIQNYDQLLKKWQELKEGIRKADAPALKDSLEEQYEAFKLELQDKYKMDPAKQYVFETTEIGIYMGCREDHLSLIAKIQKEERLQKADEVWRNSKTD